MKLAQLILVAFWTIALVACGGTEQDPLAKQPESIKQGLPPFAPKPPPERPLAQDILRIDSDSYHIFRDNTEKEILITARAEFNDAIYQLNITNLNTFRGATVEAVDGDSSVGRKAELRFKWTPPKGLTYADIVTLRLKVEVYTTNYENNYKQTRDLEIFIYNEYTSVPEILSLGGLSGSLKEGDTGTFKVKVKDIDSTVDNPPSLVVSSDEKDINGAPYLSWGSPVQDIQDPTIWYFDVNVNLNNKELTSSKSIAGYKMGVIGASLRRSSLRSGSFTVLNKVEIPLSTWLTPVDFMIGKENRFEFHVFDPKGDGSLTAQFMTTCLGLPGSPRCDCAPQIGLTGKANTLATCTLAWSVPLDTLPQRLQLEYRADNKSTVVGDTQTANKTFFGIINLVL